MFSTLSSQSKGLGFNYGSVLLIAFVLIFIICLVFGVAFTQMRQLWNMAGMDPVRMFSPGAVDNNLVDAASNLCNSNDPIPGSARYAKARDLHPILIFTEEQMEMPLESEYPEGWLAADLGQVELVACVGPQEQHREICEYDYGPPVDHFTYMRYVNLYRAHDRELVATIAISGGNEGCPLTLDRDVTVVDEDSVDMKMVMEHLEEYVVR